MHLVLLGEILKRRLTDIHHHFDNLAGECERRFVQLRDRRAGITADIEAFVGREITRNLFFEAAASYCLFSEAQGDCAARAELAFLVGFYFCGKYLASRWDGLGRRDTVALLVVVVVLPVQFAVLHEDGKASPDAATTNEDALGATLRYLYLSGNCVVHVFGVRRRSLTDPNSAWRIDEVRYSPDMAGVQRRIGTLGEAIVEGQHVVLGRLGHEPILQFTQLLWL